MLTVSLLVYLAGTAARNCHSTILLSSLDRLDKTHMRIERLEAIREESDDLSLSERAKLYLGMFTKDYRGQVSFLSSELRST